MLTIGMYYDVIPEKGKLFEDKFVQVVELMKRMKGHRQSFLYRRVDDPHSYAIIGEWDTQEDFTAFIRSDAFHQVTAWGREQVLRGAPRHKIYPRSEDMARGGAPVAEPRAPATGKCPVTGHGA
jgi:heme-degrading monooxygenase HmoA